MSTPGFTAEASLEKPRGHYHSAHAFTEAGGNALLPAQRDPICCAPEPHPPLMPWGSGWTCFGQCAERCRRWCGRDFLCNLDCRDPWCYVGCNLNVP
jgi:hypothetical protein